MKASKLYELQSQLHTQGITFAYCGYITENILTGVGQALKNKLKSEDADTRTTRSVFAVFVEQMQNMIHYSAEQTSSGCAKYPQSARDDTRYGILTIGQIGDDYIVHSGNLIVTADVPGMRARLTELQKKTPEELKVEYMSQLRSGQDTFERGSGVGFIEIARRTSKPIEFEFTDVNDDHSFFAIRATIRGRESC